MQCFEDKQKQDSQQHSEATKEMLDVVGAFERKAWVSGLEAKFEGCAGLCQVSQLYFNRSNG